MPITEGADRRIGFTVQCFLQAEQGGSALLHRGDLGQGLATAQQRQTTGTDLDTERFGAWQGQAVESFGVAHEFSRYDWDHYPVDVARDGEISGAGLFVSVPRANGARAVARM
ncbi:hypothetical protein D9M70_601600 [compost metagenome]